MARRDTSRRYPYEFQNYSLSPSFPLSLRIFRRKELKMFIVCANCENHIFEVASFNTRKEAELFVSKPAVLAYVAKMTTLFILKRCG